MNDIVQYIYCFWNDYFFKFDIISYQISLIVKYLEFLTTKIRKNLINFMIINLNLKFKIRYTYIIHTLQKKFNCIDFSHFFDEINNWIIKKTFREITLIMYLIWNQHMFEMFISCESKKIKIKKQFEI